MAIPAPKSPEIERLLEGFSGRTTAIEADRCVDEPIGCGKPVEDFRDDASADEYRLSGLCQICQNDLFGS
jgi:hypothetical protein